MNLPGPTNADGLHDPHGWLLYDDSCGFCQRWVPTWGSTLRHLGYDIAPLQSDWVRARLGLSDVEVFDDIRLLLRDDSQVKGADVYRYFMRRIWWVWPLYVLTIMPGLRWIFDRAYRTFANNRFGFSKACGLKPRPAPPSPNDLPHR